MFRKKMMNARIFACATCILLLCGCASLPCERSRYVAVCISDVKFRGKYFVPPDISLNELVKKAGGTTISANNTNGLIAIINYSETDPHQPKKSTFVQKAIIPQTHWSDTTLCRFSEGDEVWIRAPYEHEVPQVHVYPPEKRRDSPLMHQARMRWLRSSIWDHISRPGMARVFVTGNINKKKEAVMWIKSNTKLKELIALRGGLTDPGSLAELYEITYSVTIIRENAEGVRTTRCIEQEAWDDVAAYLPFRTGDWIDVAMAITN
jgi:hypothetical protein